MKKKLLLFTVVFAASVSFVTGSLSQTAQAAFPGDNGKIVFLSNRDGNNEIYTMNTDGMNLIRLTNNTASDAGAKWSPDNNKIVFASDRDGNQEVYIMNADGSGQSRLTTNSVVDGSPAFSPDGTKIVFESRTNGSTPQIFTMNADGSSKTLITDAGQAPAWSPDGTKLAFYRNDGNYDIWVMNADGSDQVKLTINAPSVFDTNPDWSPDGSKLLFETNRDSNLEIYAMNADGTSPTRLTTNSAIDSFASFSPDGTKVAFRSERDGNKEIYIMNSDGSAQVNITNNVNLDSGPPHFQSLIGSSVINPDGSKTTTIAANQNYPTVDYTVSANETLVLNGQLCDVTVQSGGTLKGTGTACTITVEPGGTINPGNSPGCLVSGDLSLSGTYVAELAGATPCSGYDQLQVTGTVTVGGTLNTSLLNGFAPASGNVFTIITNDSTDPVTGTFAGLAEGASISISSTQFRISYVGGTGNDVTLTALPGLPQTGNLPAAPTSLRMFLTIASEVILLGSFWVVRQRFIQTRLTK